ncbi:hypothetical protein IG631_23755 [Alternaria alternata]|nr:hypothetical protein IG631_23755 [Alternaria alternata]
MQQCSLVERSPNSSFKPGTSLIERDYSGPTGDNVNPDTNLSYANLFADKDDKDRAYLSPDNDHPPEYYIQQLKTFNEEEYVKEDYKKSSTRLLNYMEDQ